MSGQEIPRDRGIFHNDERTNSSGRHICVPNINNSTSKRLKQKLTDSKGKIEESTIIVKDS